MRITEVKIVPVNEERLRAYVSIAFDDCFVISEIKIIRAKEGYILRMPQRKTADGFYLDVAYPIDKKMRQMVEVFTAYQPFAGEPVKRPLPK